MSFPPSSTDTTFGFCASIAVTCDCPGASTRGYWDAWPGSGFSGVAVSAWPVRAPSIATLPVGSTTPLSFGMHWRSEKARPAPSPLVRTPLASGAANGAAQPGA